MKRSELALFAAAIIGLTGFLPPIDMASIFCWCVATGWLIVARNEQKKGQ